MIVGGNAGNFVSYRRDRDAVRRAPDLPRWITKERCEPNLGDSIRWVCFEEKFLTVGEPGDLPDLRTKFGWQRNIVNFAGGDCAQVKALHIGEGEQLAVGRNGCAEGAALWRIEGDLSLFHRARWSRG